MWELLDHNKPDVICLCETWLNTNISNNEILPPNYKIYRCDRDDGYGGILLGITSDVLCDVIDAPSHLEVCSVLLKLSRNTDVIIICAYRPPRADTTYQTNLCKYIIDIVDKYPEKIVCCFGDFNLPDIDWENGSVISHRYPLDINELALNMSTECGFSQLVNFPTRGSNILDLFFTSHPSFVEQCIPLTEISDHCAISVTMKLSITYQKSIGYKVYQWNRANLQEMKKIMMEFSSKLTQDYSVDTPVEVLWSLFHNKVLSLINTFVPSKIRHANNHKPWITHKIKQLRRHKQKAYNKARQTNLLLHWTKFKDLKREMQRECRSSYNKYMSDIIHDSYVNSKKKRLYSYIKSLRKDYCGVPTLQKDGVRHDENQAKARILNQYFSSVFTNDEHLQPPPDLGPSPYPNIPNIEISCEGITHLLNDLDPTKSHGPDEVPARFLKLMAAEISPSLRLLFSASLHQGSIPQVWKQAIVTPLFKKGDRSNPSNYRPISLTCICCKVLEHIVHTNIMSHFSMHNVLSESQFGFRKNHSAELQLIKTSHDFAVCLNNQGQTDAVLLDFSKAFDKVPHHLLLTKLQHYGIRGSIWNWITDFLHNRTQRVVCGGATSKPTNVTSGVPQGSVLGPLLFLAYINDISTNLSSSCRLFADDCILYREINTPTDAKILQEDLKKLELWEETWGMKFNIEKCMILTITLKHNPHISEYTLHGKKLTSVTNAKYLGINFDSKLTFNHHVNSVCQKANNTLAFLRRNLRRCHQRVKLDAYKIFVLPILNYAATVWSPHSQCYIHKLEAVQKRAARFIVSDYRRLSSITRILNSLKLKSIVYQHTRLCLLTFYKIVNHLVELPIPTYIVHSTRCLRGNYDKFIKPSATVDAYKFSFYPRSITLWNQLPIDHIFSLNDFDTILQSTLTYSIINN